MMAGKRGLPNVNDHLTHQSDTFANLVGGSDLQLMVGEGGVRFAINPMCKSFEFVKKFGILCKIYLGTHPAEIAQLLQIRKLGGEGAKRNSESIY